MLKLKKECGHLEILRISSMEAISECIYLSHPGNNLTLTMLF